MLKKQIANHSERLLKLDLQLFADNEDVILPDDFQEVTSEAEEALTDDFENVEAAADTTETAETETKHEEQLSEEQQAFLRVKYNKEELELDEATARELAQKGMNYDKLQEKLQQVESDPRLSFVDEMANQFGMTVPEYLDAVRQQREQDQLNELIQNNIPEDLAQEILESRKDRESRKQQEQARADEQKKNAEFGEFFAYFKQANGRDFNPGQDEIPQEVWAANQNGTPLKYAYMEHHNNQMKSQLQVFKQNNENTQKAPVTGISAHGSEEVASEDDFLRGFNSI